MDDSDASTHHRPPRTHLRVIGIAFLALLCGTDAALCRAGAAPNLLVLMADDLDEATLARAHELGLLPNIDAELRDGGLRFEQSFVSNSLCCPSRTTFQTGQYTHNHKVHNITVGGSFAAFDDRETLAVWLQRAGYRTGLIGKFLNGYGHDQPLNCATCDRRTYIPPGWNDWQALPDVGELNGTPQAGYGYAGAYCMYNYTININGNLVNFGSDTADYQVDVIARRAADFIDVDATGRPFFLYLAPVTPHYELCLPAADPFEWDIRPARRHAGSLPGFVQLDMLDPAFNESDVSDKPAWFVQEFPPMSPRQVDSVQRQYRNRLESLRSLDDLVGTLKARLVANSQWENTILIFTSDNGWLYGDHRAWGKVLAYEASIRVPLLLRGPGIPAGSQRQALVLNNDLAPTLLELGGADAVRPMDGRSLLPVIAADRPVDWRRRILIEHYRDSPGFPISFADFFAVRSDGESAQAGPGKLIRWSIDAMPYGEEYYRLARDPHELDSLESMNATVRERAVLRASLALLRECGMPGRLSCDYAERMDELLHYDGFDGLPAD